VGVVDREGEFRSASVAILLEGLRRKTASQICSGGGRGKDTGGDITKTKTSIHGGGGGGLSADLKIPQKDIDKNEGKKLGGKMRRKIRGRASLSPPLSPKRWTVEREAHQGEGTGKKKKEK